MATNVGIGDALEASVLMNSKRGTEQLSVLGCLATFDDGEMETFLLPGGGRQKFKWQHVCFICQKAELVFFPLLRTPPLS